MLLKDLLDLHTSLFFVPINLLVRVAERGRDRAAFSRKVSFSFHVRSQGSGAVDPNGKDEIQRIRCPSVVEREKERERERGKERKEPTQIRQNWMTQRQGQGQRQREMNIATPNRQSERQIFVYEDAERERERLSKALAGRR